MGIKKFATTLGIGALAAYLLDADRGRARRARLSESAQRAADRVLEFKERASRDASLRGQGWMDYARARMFERDVPPEQLAERVRSRIGRAVSNPGAIEVRTVEGGRVALSGPLLRREQNRLLAMVWSTPGVMHVENGLELHDAPGNIPELQGAEDAEWDDDARDSWAPAVRLAAGAGGALALASGLMSRHGGLLRIAAGGALIARAVFDERLSRIFGLAGADSVHVDKQLFIAAPPERVFEFWRNPTEFPRVMHHVIDVNPLGEDRWRWTVSGPAGRRVEWESETVDVEQNRLVAWRTCGEPSMLEHEGCITFEPEGEGTRVHLEMDYAPAAGMVGDLAARLLGGDAKTLIDEDMMRLKTFLETGTPAHDAARKHEGGEAGQVH